MIAAAATALASSAQAAELQLIKYSDTKCATAVATIKLASDKCMANENAAASLDNIKGDFVKCENTLKTVSWTAWPTKDCTGDTKTLVTGKQDECNAVGDTNKKVQSWKVTGCSSSSSSSSSTALATAPATVLGLLAVSVALFH